MKIKLWAQVFFVSLLIPLFIFSEEKEKTTKQKPKIAHQLRVYFTTDLLFFENADLAKYNPSTYQQNQALPYANTDDRNYFIYSTVGIDYSAKLENSVFFADVFRYGYWGNDNLEGRDDGKNGILFGKLYFNYYFSSEISLSLGRMPYSIGNSISDYFFADTIDGFKINLELDKSFYIHFMGDVLGIASKPDTYFFSTEKDSEKIDDFKGETFSLRAGLSASYHFIKIFGYYLRYGANNQGGADRAENGFNSLNQPDGDFLTLSGLRLFLKDKNWGQMDLTLAYSYGKDYQFAGEKSYHDMAAALNLRMNLFERFVFLFSSGYFGSQFCSMKGFSMGGLLLYQYKGYFPSAYAGPYHFKDYAKKDPVTFTDLTVSKTFGQLGFEFQEIRWKLGLSLLLLYQTENMEYMGVENELYAEITLTNLKFYLKTGFFIPSFYYQKHHTENKYLPDGKSVFYGFNFGVTFFFDI